MIVDIVFGFLGAGKTTFITRVLQEWGSTEKTVVLVNEFGDVDIDGELLKAQGGNVVEMPSGCICCTLQVDFRAQLLEISQKLHPKRVIVEPTGVATIAQVHAIIEAQIFENTVRQINDILIADATGFMELYKANRHFVESQILNADIGLLNKCDKVDKRQAMVTRSAISAINPEISILMTEFGAVDWNEYQLALSAAPRSRNDQIRDEHHRGDDEAIIAPIETKPHEGHLHFHAEQDALGYESYGRIFDDVAFDQTEIEKFFHALNTASSPMGEIVRAKGIFRIGDRGMLMELASREFSSQPTKALNQSKVSIIGKELNREKISAALKRCILSEGF
jgi:G3E family GTPase